MKRLIAVLGLMTALAIVAAACRPYLPSNRYLQLRKPSQAATSTADARHAFEHARHAAPLAAATVTCVDCHRFDVVIDTGNEPMARELSGRSLYPGNQPCHFCHGGTMARAVKAPEACTTCHQNIAPLLPADHDVAWLKVHASASRANPVRCENCHQQSFCINCHERRDSIQTIVHDRNFRYFHSVEARANPIKCGSCHRADFCINCHQQGKVQVP